MARMYAVDRRVYIGDEARPMYNASVFGMELYYVPADDLAPLGRRAFLYQAVAALLFSVMVAGVARHAWSGWWIAAAVGAFPLAVAYVGRWVREHYQPVSDPAVFSLVHQRLIQDTQPIAAGLLYILVTLPDTAQWIQRTGDWSDLGVVTVLFALQMIPRIVRRRERRMLQVEGRAS